MAPGIYGFNKMVVCLKDFDESIAAYTKLFPAGPRQTGKDTTMGLQFALFDLANGGYIEICAPSGPKSVLQPALDKRGPGMNFISFQCEDLAATVKTLKENGVKVIDNDPHQIMVHPKSTHGVLMQLVEKAPDASRATKTGNVPDTSGLHGSIVSYKCTVVFVNDVDEGIASYKKLPGLKLGFDLKNKATGIRQAGFFLKGGGMIELIGPLDPSDASSGFVKLMKTRGEGFKHLSLDGSAGVLDVLSAAGVRARKTDPEHADIHKDATLTKEMLLQLNPVGMGTKAQVSLGEVRAKL